MELLLEVVIYLLVVLGLITVCFTFFNKFNFLSPMVSDEIIEEEQEIKEGNTYYREKKENEKVTMNIRYKNISEEELNKIKECIEIGNYVSINDVADEVNYIDSTQRNKGNKR